MMNYEKPTVEILLLDEVADQIDANASDTGSSCCCFPCISPWG